MSFRQITTITTIFIQHNVHKKMKILSRREKKALEASEFLLKPLHKNFFYLFMSTHRRIRTYTCETGNNLENKQ